MAYPTSDIRTTQKVRRAGDKAIYLDTHADADFSKKNVITCQACDAGGVEIPGYCVDANYFSAARFGSQANAETHFQTFFRGISTNEYLAGDEGHRMTIMTECEVEYDLASPGVVRNGTYITWAWDATNNWIENDRVFVGTQANSIGRSNDDLGGGQSTYATAVIDTKFTG